MTVDLGQFPSDKYAALIALPFRVGLFVSQSDMTGGEESTAQEMAALENIVTFFVEDALKSEFAQEVMIRTLQHRADWHAWHGAIQSVPEECGEIIQYFEERIDQRSLLAFKNNLLEIAFAVASAYQEAPKKVGLGDRITAFITHQKDESETLNAQYANVSAAEKAAIIRLADTFKIPLR